MKRNVTLEEISDGRLYGLQDMVKADYFRWEDITRMVPSDISCRRVNVRRRCAAK